MGHAFCCTPCCQATHGVEATDKLFLDIEACVVSSLRAVCNIMINDKYVSVQVHASLAGQHPDQQQACAPSACLAGGATSWFMILHDQPCAAS